MTENGSPRMLGRYELVEQLGEGGMGSVWLARLTGAGGFEKLCIVKTVLPNIASDKEFVSRFLHEGRVLTQLQHSNIAQVYDMSEDHGTLFLALEFVPGVDLARLAQKVRDSGQPLPLAVALYVMQQVAEGLGFAHRKTALDGTPLGVVHRDVSPQNIMVSYDGEVKVIDFGIAKSEARSHATAQASVMGKLGYMAPEQARGELVDHRADQYAAAVVLWELLANAPFVARGTLTEMVVAMAHPVPRPLTPLRPDVPPTLEKVVMAALSADPANRFATTDDFARALQDELLRLSGLPTRRQIGEFVRANCQGEYAAQQTLLTRVGTMRGQPFPAQPATVRATPLGDATAIRTPQAPSMATPGPSHEGGATGVLSSAQLPQPVTAPARPAGMSGPVPPAAVPSSDVQSPAVPSPAATGTPMTTAQLSAAAMPPSRMPLYLAGGVVVLALVAGGAWLATRNQKPEVPTTTTTTPPSKPDGTTVAAIVPELTQVAEGRTPKPVEIYSEGGSFYVRAGANESLVPGQVLSVVGADKRTRVGVATVRDVFPQRARVELDDAAAGTAGERYAALGEAAPKPAGDTVTAPPLPPPGTTPPPFPPPGDGSAITSMVEVKKAVEIFTDAGQTWMRAGKGDRIQVGQVMIVVGAAEAGRRVKYGTATVMEVQKLMSRVILDAPAASAPGKLFAALTQVKELNVAPPGVTVAAGAIEVKKAVELFTDGDKLYARAGKGDNLQPGQVMTVVGPAAATGKLRQKLGSATVMEVFPLMSRVALDAAAQGAPEPRFVALEAGGAKAEGGIVTGGGKLTGHLRLQRTPLWAIVLTNSSGFGWSSCSVYVPGKRKGTLKTLGNGFQREMDLNFFTDDPSAPVLQDEVKVVCKEGSVTFPAK